ncbi:MAG: nitroreductase family protein [candidate division WOR-3 bacterium]
MELRDAIVGRRSIRRYKSTPVPKELIEEIFEYALWAPSGMNRQNWYFVVVTGETKDRIVEICRRAYEEYIGKKIEQVFTHKPDVVKETKSFFATLGGAPVVIVAYAEPGPESEKTDIQSVAAAIQNFLLLAYEKGLGTCWMTGPISHANEISQLLGVEGKEFVALITLGYPDENPRPPKRKPDRVIYIGFD